MSDSVTMASADASPNTGLAKAGREADLRKLRRIVSLDQNVSDDSFIYCPGQCIIGKEVFRNISLHGD